MDCYFDQAEWETGEMPLLPKLGWDKPANPCVPANGVTVGMKINYQRTRGSVGIYEVMRITPLFNGSFQFKCKGFSESGVEIHPSLTYTANETVEAIR